MVWGPNPSLHIWDSPVCFPLWEPCDWLLEGLVLLSKSEYLFFCGVQMPAKMWAYSSLTCFDSKQCMMKTSAPWRLLRIVKIYATAELAASSNRKAPNTHMRPSIHIWAMDVTVKALILCSLDRSGLRLANFWASFHTVMIKNKTFTMIMKHTGPKKLQMRPSFRDSQQYWSVPYPLGLMTADIVTITRGIP